VVGVGNLQLAGDNNRGCFARDEWVGAALAGSDVPMRASDAKTTPVTWCLRMTPFSLSNARG
jgi:hypothetical protein